MRYAIIDSGVVVNVILWDGLEDIPEFNGAVEVKEGAACYIGDFFNDADGIFYGDKDFSKPAGSAERPYPPYEIK